MKKYTCFCIAALVAALALPLVVQAQGGPPVGAPPFAGAAKMTTEQALKQAPKDDKSLLPMEKALGDSEAKMKKAPKDAKLKQAYVEAAYKYGHQVTYGQTALSTVVKYRAGLALYRKALAVDPKHAASLKEKTEIESIYKQMGRDIPK